MYPPLVAAPSDAQPEIHAVAPAVAPHREARGAGPTTVLGHPLEVHADVFVDDLQPVNVALVARVAPHAAAIAATPRVDRWYPAPTPAKPRMNAPPSLESIILVRHARSTANVDPRVYLTTPDHRIPLHAPEDDADAAVAGARIGTLGLDPWDVCVWCSTFLRCRQTESLVMRAAFGARADGVDRRESFLLRELEYGDWDGLSDEQLAARDPERFARKTALADAYARFYFRYPNGESRADVAERAAAFVGKLHHEPRRHHVLFTHGVPQRALRMVWLDRTIEWFDKEPNPANASVLLIRRDATGAWTERYL